MSWGAQSQSKDAKTPSTYRAAGPKTLNRIYGQSSHNRNVPNSPVLDRAPALLLLLAHPNRHRFGWVYAWSSTWAKPPHIKDTTAALGYYTKIAPTSEQVVLIKYGLRDLRAAADVPATAYGTLLKRGFGVRSSWSRSGSFNGLPRPGAARELPFKSHFKGEANEVYMGRGLQVPYIPSVARPPPVGRGSWWPTHRPSYDVPNFKLARWE
jgi:hypothetical protein